MVGTRGWGRRDGRECFVGQSFKLGWWKFWSWVEVMGPQQCEVTEYRGLHAWKWLRCYFKWNVHYYQRIHFCTVISIFWRAAVHGVAKNRTRLSNWTELNNTVIHNLAMDRWFWTMAPTLDRSLKWKWDNKKEFLYSIVSQPRDTWQQLKI